MGKSITVQDWWKEIARDLKERFPYADLEIENRAIGGFASQSLVRVAEHDLYPFYPDLMIFYVYGDHTKYDEIIRNTRSRTTAEILMQTEHVSADKDQSWPEKMSYELLPEIAKKYGCELANIRDPWKAYLKDNNLEPQALLNDAVHLNKHGNFLMAELLKPYLRYDHKFTKNPWKDLVKEYALGKEIQVSKGVLELELTGNRIDLLTSGEQSKTDVLIDGKKPSQFPEAYYLTRPSNALGMWWPAIKRVSWEKPLVLEDWKAVITEINPDSTKFKFKVIGSITGDDGQGTNEARFLSKSGRVVVEPEDWFLKESFDYSKKLAPVGFEITWKAAPLFKDSFEPPKIVDNSKEYSVTVVQGIKNDKHVLRLTWDKEKPCPVKTIRVYSPPIK